MCGVLQTSACAAQRLLFVILIKIFPLWLAMHAEIARAAEQPEQYQEVMVRFSSWHVGHAPAVHVLWLEKTRPGQAQPACKDSPG